MRATQLFSKTLREDPAEAETVSHRLMLRAGMISQVATGVYSYLPLALRSMRKIESIIRDQLDALGAQELRMPSLQPIELWRETNRDAGFGDNLFRLQDRRTRDMVLAPTHEEVVTSLARANINSYRDLPLLVYQIQTKFRDEPRPRAGLIRVREFDMKDAYSFDADEGSLDETYSKILEAYKVIFQLCGLPTLVVEADSGAIGGKDSHEFILPADSGEDVILMCGQCNYAANSERAKFNKMALEIDPENSLELVETPGIKTIHALTEYLGIPSSKTLKAVFYVADQQTILVTIRGDFEVNEIKLKNLLQATDLRLATPQESEEAGLTPGYTSPIGKKGILVIADDSINLANNFAVGGNKEGYHFINANYPRDFAIDLIGDIALAGEGHACPGCGQILKGIRGIEVGHIFKLGTYFTETLGANYLDANGTQKPMIMGCYGIGVGRLFAAAIEQSNDEKGIIFPPPIAPYQIHLISLNPQDASVESSAEALYALLRAADYEVLYDDRIESAGVKFNDADLLGLPIRLVVSARNIKQGIVEAKLRHEDQGWGIRDAEIVAELKKVFS